MPYRRLPNTDNARIKALKTAIYKKRASLRNEVFTNDVTRLEGILRNFESAQIHYKNSLEIQAGSNKKFQKLIKDARMYVSHFIQVLNLSIIRNEFKKVIKKLYCQDINSLAVPDLSSNDALLECGENIIKGEQERLFQGGIPIYNPSIARVNVAFSQFKEAYIAQKVFQETTSRYLDEIASQRDNVDEIICDLWNQIEAFFADRPETERLECCKEFGVIYYLRKSEREKLNDDLTNFPIDENN